MTITLPLEARDEARLIAAAKAKGVSPAMLIREALERMLADPEGLCASSEAPMGAALVAAMQSSPHKEIELAVEGSRLPVRAEIS
jgi:hypothetical protein